MVCWVYSNGYSLVKMPLKKQRIYFESHCKTCNGSGTYKSSKLITIPYDGSFMNHTKKDPYNLYFIKQGYLTPNWYRRRLIIAMKMDGATYQEISMTFKLCITTCRRIYIKFCRSLAKSQGMVIP